MTMLVRREQGAVAWMRSCLEAAASALWPLGIVRRRTKIVKGDDGAYVSTEPLDREFVRYLADYLVQSSSKY